MADRIGVIGTGNVGAALGLRLAASGYEVRFGVREGADVDALLARAGRRAAAVPAADVAAGALAVFAAVPAPATVPVAMPLPDGTVLVDCTNPVRWDAGPVWEPPEEGSVAQAVAVARPGLRVVKAFNVFGAEWHADPLTAAGPVDVPMAADDPAAKDVVAAIARAGGFHPVDAGPLRNARILEAHAVLWIHLATVGGQGRDWAFRHLGRPGPARGSVRARPVGPS
ncbi:MAG: NADPH-dependent F420 reductase [Sandaracinaceae bacterium]